MPFEPLRHDELMVVTVSAANRKPIPKTKAPTIMFVIGRGWLPGASDNEVYEATRGNWKVGVTSRDRAQYALGIAGGIVRGAYRIEQWFPSSRDGEEGRWGFIGEPAPELQAVGKSVQHLAPRPGAANPVRLFLDGVPGGDEVDMEQVSDALNAEPLARIMFGQRELFHSNLLAWFFDALPEMADAVFSPLASEGSGAERVIAREVQNLDLVLRWRGKAPLVIENKVFALPDLDQLDRYSESVDRWPEAGSSKVLLSMVEPATLRASSAANALPALENGWRYLSYDSLADRLEDALDGQSATYEVETMRHYARVVRLLSALVSSTGIEGPEIEQPVWLTGDLLPSIESPQMRQALHKMRAYRVASLLSSVLPIGRGAVNAAMSHGKPLVTWAVREVREGHSIKIGWQLQEGQFRRYIVTPHLSGRTEADLQARVNFARRNIDLISFDESVASFELTDATVQPSLGGREFGHFKPDFVYRYLKVPNVSVNQLVKVATAISKRHTVARS